MSSTPTTQRIWTLAEHPTGPVTDKTFSLDSVPLPTLKPNQALVRIDYLSNDPSFRLRISEGNGVKIGETMTATGVATILESTGKWEKGAQVFGRFGWYDYAVVDDDAIEAKAIELPGKPYASIAPLGTSALTAHQCIVDILNVGHEDTVLIDSAAGSVGSTAVQTARSLGAKRIVGIAGGAEKCAHVVKLGADACVDYKAKDFAQKLAAALPEGATRFLDMVGGEVYDLGIHNMALRGKVNIIGSLSTYNGSTYAPKYHVEIAAKRLTLQGSTIYDYSAKSKEAALAEISGWIKKGTYSGDGEVVFSGTIEKVPSIWQKLFEGNNTGKLITKLEQ